MIGLYDSNNNLITKRVESCIASPDVIEVEGRTLDGQWTLQQIGTGATVAEISVWLTLAQKAIVDGYKKTGAPVRVQFDGRFYRGYIRGTPGYERIYAPQGVKFRTSFTLLVTSEGAI